LTPLGAESSSTPAAPYVGFGKLQKTMGFMEGMTVGQAMVIPAAAIALAFYFAIPVRPAGPQRRPAHQRSGRKAHGHRAFDPGQA
jgi:hypothetical protein